MTRQTDRTRKIALLATGDEITHGDILNTNARDIAKKLFDLGMQVGTHAVVADNNLEIERTIQFLLAHHDSLIITGGLGPTSDDITRYALAKACGKELIFDQSTWDEIVARLKRFGYAEPPESNRQQALFPESATIIENPNGTAAGCFLKNNNKMIFMLPGPPSECLPMLDGVVIPKLLAADFQKTFYHHNWLLFSVSEGQIAEELDLLAKPFDVTTGYRLAYPYLEFKLYSENETDFKKLIPLVEKTISPYLISDGTQTASNILKMYLTNGHGRMQICDTATGGLLESTITTPLNFKNLNFTHETCLSVDEPTFILTGLTEFWEKKPDCTQTEIRLDYFFQTDKKTIKRQIPFRGDRVKSFAVEWASYEIRNMMKAKD